MKIARVEPLLLSCPLPEPLRLPFHGGERTILKRDAMLIRVTTDTGLRGYAPGPWSLFRLDSPPSTVAVIGDHSVKWVAPGA